MSLPHASGGRLGVPNLCKYYQAAQLRYMVERSRTLSEKYWCFIDQAIAGIHIGKVLWLPKPHRPSSVYVSPITRSTLGVWDKVQRKHNRSTPISWQTPLIGNPDFPPVMDGVAYRAWQEANCKRVRDLIDSECLMDFATPQTNYPLLNSAKWQYLAVTHWVTIQWIQPHAGRHLLPFEKWLVMRSSDKKLLSDIYAFLTQPAPHRAAGRQSRKARSTILITCGDTLPHPSQQAHGVLPHALHYQHIINTIRYCNFHFNSSLFGHSTPSWEN